MSQTIAVILSVVFFAGVASAQTCEGDFNADARVTVDEILMTVNNALNGCETGPLTLATLIGTWRFDTDTFTRTFHFTAVRRLLAGDILLGTEVTLGVVLERPAGVTVSYNDYPHTRLAFLLSYNDPVDGDCGEYVFGFKGADAVEGFFYPGTRGLPCEPQRFRSTPMTGTRQ